MHHMHDPLWFLVLALFMPRVALFLGWLDGWYFGVSGLAAPLLWIFLPRVLVLITVYYLQGIGLWFLLHVVAALIAWSGSGTVVHRRRRRNRVERLEY